MSRPSSGDASAVTAASAHRYSTEQRRFHAPPASTRNCVTGTTEDDDSLARLTALQCCAPRPVVLQLHSRCGRAVTTARLSDPQRATLNPLRGHILGTFGHKPGESQRITSNVIQQVTAIPDPLTWGCRRVQIPPPPPTLSACSSSWIP